MKKQDSNIAIGKFQLSKLNKLTEEEALFESLSPLFGRYAYWRIT